MNTDKVRSPATTDHRPPCGPGARASGTPACPRARPAWRQTGARTTRSATARASGQARTSVPRSQPSCALLPARLRTSYITKAHVAIRRRVNAMTKECDRDSRTSVIECNRNVGRRCNALEDIGSRQVAHDFPLLAAQRQIPARSHLRLADGRGDCRAPLGDDDLPLAPARCPRRTRDLELAGIPASQARNTCAHKGLCEYAPAASVPGGSCAFPAVANGSQPFRLVPFGSVSFRQVSPRVRCRRALSPGVAKPDRPEHNRRRKEMTCCRRK